MVSAFGLHRTHSKAQVGFLAAQRTFGGLVMAASFFFNMVNL